MSKETIRPQEYLPNSDIQIKSCGSGFPRPERVEGQPRLLFWGFVHRKELNFKNQGAVGWNAVSSAALAVCQVLGDKELPFRSFLHELQGFSPARDDTCQWKGCRFSSLVGAVELGAVE